MELREAFVLSALAGRRNMSDLCRRYGISRKTGYKWLGRYREEGRQGLEDRSRCPLRRPSSVSASQCEAICKERGDRSGPGAGKIRARLMRAHPGESWPSRSTVHEVLRRSGLVKAGRRRRESVGSPRSIVEAAAPNAVWSTDFKGQFLLGDGSYCYPLTVMDSFSRYLLACDALASVQRCGAFACFERLFLEMGLPDAILTDNGSPFGSSGAGGLTGLSAFWVKLGITVFRTRPGKPQDNGRHERMHRTLKAATTRPPSYDLAAQGERFGRFLFTYNEERPHEALEQVPPGTVYVPSTRLWDGVVRDPEYPPHWEARRVKRHGEIKWRNQTYYISEALGGELVGLYESGDGVWQVAFGAHPVAIYRAETDRVYPIHPRKREKGFTALGAPDAKETGRT